MEENIDVLELIKTAVYKRRDEILKENDAEKAEAAENIVKMLSIKSYIKRLPKATVLMLFNYCGFPKDKWDKYYALAFYQTVEKEHYTYINPEDAR